MKLKNKVAEFMYRRIASNLPKSKNSADGFFEKIRFFFLRGYVDSVGKKVNIQRRAKINPHVKIGDYSGIGENSYVQNGVEIGSHVMMGPDVYIYTRNHAFERIDITMDKQGFQVERGVKIGDDVWIGSRVTILPGVTIGKGCIIGASTVVTKDIPDYSVAVGNPARIVKNRKSE